MEPQWNHNRTTIEPDYYGNDVVAYIGKMLAVTLATDVEEILYE